MKKNGFRIGLIVIAIILQTTITGCVVFDKSLMDPEVPVNDHAVLYFDSAINNVNIDGDETKGGYHSPLIVHDAMVMLAPGQHTITARYATREDSGGYRYDTSTGYIAMTYNFQADRHYYMYGETSGNQIAFKITEDADPGHVKRGEKKKTSLTYPKKIAPAVTNQKLLNEAVNAVPTKFEGAWQGKGQGSIVGPTGLVAYIFEGNTYYHINDTKTLSNWADTGSDPGEIGTFEYTDTTITLTLLKKRKVGLFSLKSVLANVKPVKTEYDYTLDQNGLMLSLKGKPLGTFVKQDSSE
jgi:hypothetical protein